MKIVGFVSDEQDNWDFFDELMVPPVFSLECFNPILKVSGNYFIQTIHPDLARLRLVCSRTDLSNQEKLDEVQKYQNGNGSTTASLQNIIGVPYEYCTDKETFILENVDLQNYIAVDEAMFIQHSRSDKFYHAYKPKYGDLVCGNAQFIYNKLKAYIKNGIDEGNASDVKNFLSILLNLGMLEEFNQLYEMHKRSLPEIVAWNLVSEYHGLKLINDAIPIQKAS